jgi:hypothetical protein
MKKTIWKIAFAGLAVALLAAGCSKSQQTSGQNGAGQNNAQGFGQNPPPDRTGTPTGTPPSGMPGRGNGTSTPGGFGGLNIPQGSTPFFGAIASVNGDTLTISGRGQNGSNATTTVKVSGDTKFQNGSQSDLAAGVNIFGYGTKNSDGSISAQSVQVNPSMPQGGPGGRQGGMPGNGPQGGENQPPQ